MNKTDRTAGNGGKLRCMVVDDEPLAVKLLESFIDRTDFLELAGSYLSPAEALKHFSGEVDLLFLDVDMPGMSGLQLAGFADPSTKIIFTTAFRDYAFDSYAVHAFDYILKPITYNRFLEAAGRAREAVAEQQEGGHEAPPPLPEEERRQYDQEFIFVKCDYRMVRVDTASILYLKGLGDYVSIFLEGRRAPVTALSTMKALEERLPSGRFCRVHKSYIVNVGKVDAVERSRITIGAELIPVTDAYRERFFSMLE